MELRESVAIVIVTHNLQQALRVADHVAFMHLGELVEYGTSEQVFDRPVGGPHAGVHQRGLRVRLAALALVALALAGCETTAEKSARLEKAAKLAQKQAAAHGVVGKQGVSVAHVSRIIKVTGTTVLHSPEGAAVVVTLHNTSATAQRKIPIAITVHDASGATVYTNNEPGLVALAGFGASDSRTWRAQLGR